MAKLPSDSVALDKTLINGETIEAKMAQVINRLLLLVTRDQNLGGQQLVSWATEESDVFTTYAGGYTLRLSRNRLTYCLQIIDVNNEVVEEAFTEAGSGGAYKLLCHLHAQVRRQAMRTEEALDRILKFMD